MRPVRKYSEVLLVYYRYFYYTVSSCCTSMAMFIVREVKLKAVYLRCVLVHAFIGQFTNYIYIDHRALLVCSRARCPAKYSRCSSLR